MEVWHTSQGGAKTMGHMTSSDEPRGTRPKAKSKNKKSLGPSRKTGSGVKKGKIPKAGKNVTPKAAGEKKGTVRRSSKESRGEKPAGLSGTTRAANPGGSRRALKKPTSKSRGKNSSTSSS